MSKIARTLAVAGAAACAMYVATPAQAATNPYDPATVCGAGYTVRDHHDLRTSLGSLEATIYLAYNGSSNCVVTLNRTGLIEPWSMSATLQVQGKSQLSNSGEFSYYAGPVRASAAGQCVKWGGKFDIKSWTSDWSHCL
jgi:hypothetical protein